MGICFKIIVALFRCKSGTPARRSISRPPIRWFSQKISTTHGWTSEKGFKMTCRRKNSRLLTKVTCRMNCSLLEMRSRRGTSFLSSNPDSDTRQHRRCRVCAIMSMLGSGLNIKISSGPVLEPTFHSSCHPTECLRGSEKKIFYWSAVKT